jgi:hypothetical protein
MTAHFISFEGIDGSGKSTQARILTDALRAQGHSVTLTREPGGSAGAEEIRRLVLEGKTDRWSAETEILLFTAARRDVFSILGASAGITGTFADISNTGFTTWMLYDNQGSAHASPTPSPSWSAWSGLKTCGQLSKKFTQPSSSGSAPGSQASPTPLPRPSAWSGLGTSGQLSSPSGTPSPS